MSGREMVEPPWEELPRDIWGSIFQRLVLVDRVHASAVSKQWSSILKQYPQHAWMLLPLGYEYDERGVYVIGEGREETIRYFDLSDGTIGNLNLPLVANTWPSRGWLAMLTSIDQAILLNPISRVRIPLPPLSKFQITCISNIQVSSQDAYQLVVAASFNNKKSLAFCRPEGKRWIVFEGLTSFASITFCNGILYALVTTEDAETTPGVQTYSIKLASNYYVILKIIAVSISKISSKPKHVKPYLVDSNGELLLLLKIYCPQSRPRRIARFEAYKVEASHTICLSRLSNLDGQTLFVDGVNAVSLPADNCRRNCVYFLEDTFLKRSDSPPSGVFHLDDGRIEGLLPSGYNIAKDRYAGWCFPNCKIGEFCAYFCA